jgi:hypothetical protein
MNTSLNRVDPLTRSSFGAAMAGLIAVICWKASHGNTGDFRLGVIFWVPLAAIVGYFVVAPIIDAGATWLATLTSGPQWGQERVGARQRTY